jgi:endoglucanase
MAASTMTADTTAPADSTSPSNSSALHVAISEDAWQGDAKFTVFVDGHQAGGTYTATASHGLGQVQNVSIDGMFTAGPHTVDIHFINDAWGGGGATDRNLYVHDISLNGETLLGSAGINNAANGAMASDGSAPLNINGVVSFHTTGTTMSSTTPTTVPTATAPQSTIVLHVAEDAWKGDAQYKVFVDGHQVGGTHTATASHAAGQWQDVTLTGDFGSTGPAKVGIQFVNDAWGGTAATDRNLYVQSIDVNDHHFGAGAATNNAANGETTTAGSLILAINGMVEFHVNHTAAPTDWHLA